jgi:alpha-L-fucosidase
MRYGPIHEVWFDGANGEGPNGRQQEYDWPRFWGLVRRLQPDAVIFSDAGPDVRWIGNEQGIAGEPNWSTVDPSLVPFPGIGSEAALRSLQHGDPAGTVWRPGEADVSIRPGWFYHPAEDARVKTADQLVDLYFQSVGRNSKLLLNVPPMPSGLLHETDIARLEAMERRLTALFGEGVAASGHVMWRATGERTAIAETDLGRAVAVGIADLREDIAHGQVIARYIIDGLVDGAWRTLSRGTTIGYRNLDRFAPVVVTRVRVRIEEAIDMVRPIDIRLHAGSS